MLRTAVMFARSVRRRGARSELFSRNGKGWDKPCGQSHGVRAIAQFDSQFGQPGQEVAVSGAGLRGAAHAQVYVAGQPAKSRLVRNGGWTKSSSAFPSPPPKAAPFRWTCAPLARCPPMLSRSRSAAALGNAGMPNSFRFPLVRKPQRLVLLTRKSLEKSAVPVDEMSAWFVKLGAMDVRFRRREPAPAAVRTTARRRCGADALDLLPTRFPRRCSMRDRCDGR